MPRREKIVAVGLVVVVALILAGVSFYGYIAAKPIEKTQVNLQIDPLQEINDLENKIKNNPQEADLEKLANDYFDYAYNLRQGGSADQAKQFFTRAAQLYQQVLAQNPNKVAVWTDLGTSLYYGDQMDHAEATYQKAVQTDPKYANARINYGIFLLYERRDITKAREQFTVALQLNPSLKDAVSSYLAAAPGSQIPDYTKDIEPVIFQNCAKCHGPGGVMARAPLQTYLYVKKYVSPLDPNSQLLVKMKQGHPQKYSTETIGLIERWIMAGAPGPKY